MSNLDLIAEYISCTERDLLDLLDSDPREIEALTEFCKTDPDLEAAFKHVNEVRSCELGPSYVFATLEEFQVVLNRTQNIATILVLNARNKTESKKHCSIFQVGRK